jgi:molybdenum cofactor guanylyltransferase
MQQVDSIASPRITAVILAGGRSSRMGQNKALLTWRERPFVTHIIECLQQQVDHIAINTNSPQAFAHFGLPLIADGTAAHCGPLSGIAAALNYSNSTDHSNYPNYNSSAAFTLVIPCDNPLLSPHLVRRLFVALESERTDLAYAFSNGDSHYLYALIRNELHNNLTTFLLNRDYAVRHWYATLRTSLVDFSDQPEYFRNINSVEELAQLFQN